MRKKLYYPKSHIITRLHTTGKEWMTTDGIEYIGYYHKYVDGTILTGADYNQVTSVDLIPYIDIIAQPNNHLYKSVTTNTNVFTAPKIHFPSLTVDDYKAGFVTRYFIGRRNSRSDIMEIKVDQYNTINNPTTGLDGSIYMGISFDWKLTGPLHDIKDGMNIEYGVYDTNDRMVHLKDNDLIGLKQYLTDYVELSVYSINVSTGIKKLFGIN